MNRILCLALAAGLAPLHALAAAAPPQQSIHSFTPHSGPAGTVVTIRGAGFKGSSAAWVGRAHDATIQVLSNSEITVTVPADADSGAIGVLNAAHAAFTAVSFTVTHPVAPPSISSFAPASGPVGTVVTIKGAGFKGASAAWVGGAHDASLKVLSDKEAEVTVPADAASGLIGILKSGSEAVASAVFTLTGAAAAAPPLNGLAIRVQGNQFVDAAGQAVQLRGVNFSGFESVAIQGWDPADPSGAQGGQAGGPNWSAIGSWRANVVRLPLNEASWLGYSCVDSGGVVHNPDPGGNYRSAVESQVSEAVAAGLYVILDLHWAAPGKACPMLQTQMADADHSLAFWQSVAKQFKSNPAVLFELYNEPYFDFEFSGDAWSAMMQGSGGSFTGYPATGNSGTWQDIKSNWAVASYQQMIDTVRATGASNVVVVGTMQYSEDLSGWLQYRPSDPLGQMAAAWHAYPTFGNAWGTAAYAQPNNSPQVWSEAQQIRAAGIPVIATETGDQDNAGTVGSPLVSNVTAFADQNGVSVIGWAWDVWGDANNVLITDAAGDPTDGYGVFFRDWMVSHP
jgi:hypothetical protein